jgi:hypothetical protein
MKNHIDSSGFAAGLKAVFSIFPAIVILFSTFVWAQNKGPAEVVIPGGTTGDVPLKHHLHQKVLGDCNLCHNLFPQKGGMVQKLKDEGKLEKKKLMNQCQRCHREKANDGLKSGPVTCKTCHSK